MAKHASLNRTRGWHTNRSWVLAFALIAAILPRPARAQTGTITGTVTDAGTGAPIQGVVVRIYLRSSTQTTLAGSASTNASGVYAVSGLSAAVHYANASGAGAGHTSEIYDDILCPGTCSSSTTVSSGVGLSVGSGLTVSGINFTLDVAGSIAGTVLNEQTLAPMQGVNVQAYARLGLSEAFFGSASSDVSGAFTIAGLPTGTYQLFTSTNQATNEIYPNIQCPETCSATLAVASGAPVAVSGGSIAAGKDFQLAPGGAVSGTVTDALTLAPLANIHIRLYLQAASSLRQVASGSTNASGVYSIGGLQAGTYFAVASPFSTYVVEVFGGPACGFCSNDQILSGTPIAVALGATTAGRDIALNLEGTITGTVTSSATAPCANNR